MLAYNITLRFQRIKRLLIILVNQNYIFIMSILFDQKFSVRLKIAKFKTTLLHFDSKYHALVWIFAYLTFNIHQNYAFYEYEYYISFKQVIN